MKRWLTALVLLAVAALTMAPSLVVRGPAVVGAATVDVHMLVTGDGTTGTVSTTTLTDCTFSADANAWTIPDGPTDIEHHADGNLGALRYPAKVGGNTYTGANTNGLRLSIATNEPLRCLRDIGDHDYVLIGFFFKCGPETDFAQIDFVNIEGTTGAEWAAGIWRSNSPPLLRVHSASAPSLVTLANGTPNQLYWIQLKYKRNTTATMAAWTVSGSTYAIVTGSPASIDMTAANIPASRIYWPEVEPHGELSPTAPYFYFSNLVVKWADGSDTLPAVETLYGPEWN